MLGGNTVVEARCLLTWLRDSIGVNALAVAGASMGGLHASMTAALSPLLSLGVVSYLGPPSAVFPFCDGLMSEHSVHWEELEKTIPEQMCVRSALRDFLAFTDLRSFDIGPCDPAAAVVIQVCHEVGTSLLCEVDAPRTERCSPALHAPPLPGESRSVLW